MKLTLITVGKPKDKRVASLAGEYLERLAHIRPGLLSIEYVPDQSGTPEQRIEREGREILRTQRVRPRDRLILLNEDGDLYGSEAFAALLERELSLAAGRVLMVIGGPWGVAADVKARADVSLSLSPMTFPHELCFLFITEQLYRAFSILQGAKYHH